PLAAELRRRQPAAGTRLGPVRARAGLLEAAEQVLEHLGRELRRLRDPDAHLLRARGAQAVLAREGAVVEVQDDDRGNRLLAGSAVLHRWPITLAGGRAVRTRLREQRVELERTGAEVGVLIERSEARAPQQ